MRLGPPGEVLLPVGWTYRAKWTGTRLGLFDRRDYPELFQSHQAGWFSVRRVNNGPIETHDLRPRGRRPGDRPRRDFSGPEAPDGKRIRTGRPSLRDAPSGSRGPKGGSGGRGGRPGG